MTKVELFIISANFYRFLRFYGVLYDFSTGETVHCIHLCLISYGDIRTHCNFIGVSSNLTYNCCRYAHLKSSTNERTSASMSAENCPFRVHFIISHIIFIIAVFNRRIKSTYLTQVLEIFIHLLIGYYR